MYIKRQAELFLQKWKDKPNRKPLIIRGARQIGKSRLITEFGKHHFKHLIILELEKEPELCSIFERNSSIQDIIKEIEIIKNTKIVYGETLIFIDEIQECPQALLKLRYFYEDTPLLHIIAAGSLLEFTLENESLSFPVGRVEFYYLYPINYSEFLNGIGEVMLLEHINNCDPYKGIEESIHSKARKLLKDYFLAGGMPEAVVEFINTKRYLACEPIWEGLIETYRADFKKYSKRVNTDNIEFVFLETPKLVGQQVNLTRMGSGTLKYREIKQALHLLEMAMIIYRVSRLLSVSFPLIASPHKRAKLLFLDTGLVQYINRISIEILNSTQYSSIYKGGFTEQFVGQELESLLYSNKRPELFYWQKDNPRGTAEIDFVYPFREHIIPIEVKAGLGNKLFSLHQFMYQYNPPFAIRVYDGALKTETIQSALPQTQGAIKYTLLSVPLYLIHRIPFFCEEIMREK